MRYTPKETAYLLASLFKKSGKNRARISSKTFRFLSRRKNIKVAFLTAVLSELDDLDFIMVNLNRGGWGILPSSALDGAPAITAKKFFEQSFRLDIRKEKVNFEKLYAEFKADEDPEDFDDE